MHVAEGICRWLHKGRLVEPVIDAPVREVGIANLIRVLISSLSISVVIRKDRERHTTLDVERRRSLPSAKSSVEQEVIVQESTPFADRKLPDHPAFEGIANVEV